MNFQISGQKITKEAKYLGMVMNEHLNQPNGLLAKLRHYVNPILLRKIHYAIFESHLRYGCELWGQTQMQVLQNIEKNPKQSPKSIGFPWE